MSEPAAARLRAGLDIGGTKTLAVVVDERERVVGQASAPTVRGERPVVDGAVGVVRKALGAAGVGLGALATVGIGTPGVVDTAAGTVRHAVNLGLGDRPVALADRVSTALGRVPVRVDNDLNVAALGAAHLADPGRGAVDLAYLALGTGVAAGLVLDGRLRRGTAGAAGEIGHVVLDDDGPPCPCGQRGCLELYASGSALAAAWPTPQGRHPPAELVAAVAAGDERARAAWTTFTDAVAAGVLLLGLTVDVPVVVLGGGVARLGQPLLVGVRQSLARAAARSAFLTSLDLPARVRLSPPDVPVAAVGAALLGTTDRHEAR